MSNTTERVDKWLWSIRAFKTRSISTDACKGGKVQINGVNAKPSKEIKAGDVVSVKKMPVIYSFRVIEPISKRQGAKLVSQFAENITPQSEIDKLQLHNNMIFMQRDRGAGRPTKKERRDIGDLMEEYFYEDEE